MIGEFAIGGVLVSSVLISGLLALALGALARRLFVWWGLYRFVWHPALFDAALFIILWAAVIRLAPTLSLAL